MGTQTSKVEARREQDYERYEAHRRFEESTDIAERLGYPIDLTISYEMRNGAAYCMTDTKDRPFHQQTSLAKNAGRLKFTGNQAFEYIRLSHEHDEALLIDQFGSGALDGNVIIKFSKVPDAVTAGQTNISGYRRDLMRSFARLYWRDGDTVHCRLLTLDHNNAAGLAAVSQLIDLPLTDRDSETILADHRLLSVDDAATFVEDLGDVIKLHYDNAVYQTTGERTYAGSRYADQSEAMSVISAQQLLMEQHMSAIAKIVGLGLNEEDRESQLERERKRTAAAIKLAHQGVSVGSNSDASVSAEVSSGNYERECPTATTGMNQAQSMENKWSKGDCVACLTQNVSVGSCGVCKGCEDKSNQGEDLYKVREKALKKEAIKQAIAKRAAPTERKEKSDQKKLSKLAIAKQQYGEHVAVRLETGIGGADHIVYDRKTLQTIGKL